MELISNVPSSSSSSNTSQFKHDVFISFRGEDTRYNFISHLHKALRDKQIQTYIDDKLNTGDKISQSLVKAIEESKISVIIFSEGYASSRWCLQELVKILECKKSYGQIVIPVFYGVDPSNVRKQTGTFGDAFRKHDQQQSLDQVQRWKDALKEAAFLSGWDSSTIKYQSVLIENIVIDILMKLNDMSASDAKGLVGIDTKIEQTVSLSGREDVRSVGIWGIGGIGKTTLAKTMEYLKPVNFYKKIFKDILKKEDYSKPGRLLGLGVSEKYVSLAVSDCKNKTAVPLRVVDRQEINMSSMADMIQSLIPEHNIVGFVVGTRKTHLIDAIFIDNLCKTGKFEGLKYTLWDCEITSKNAEFVFNQHLKYILEILNQPSDMSETIMEKCFAVSALQGYLDCTNKMLKEDWD